MFTHAHAVISLEHRPWHITLKNFPVKLLHDQPESLKGCDMSRLGISLDSCMVALSPLNVCIMRLSTWL